MEAIQHGRQLKNEAPDKKESRAARIRSAVIDASSAILLAKAGLLERLAGTFRLTMVSSVFAETTRSGYSGANTVKRLREDGGISVCDPAATDFSMDSALGVLHTGERDTIAAWLQGIADFVIIDDGRGAGYCRDRGIPYINALLVPRIWVMGKRMAPAEAQRCTETILALGRYAPWIVRYAATCPAGELDFFLP